MKVVVALALIFSSVLLAGCLDGEGEDEESCTPAPWDCEHTRPTSAKLEIQTGGGALQHVRVYSGSTYEDGKVVWSGKSGGTISLPLGPYSAVAEYLVNGVTILAVDRDELSYSESDTCEGTCYETSDGLVELQLESD